MLLLLVLLVLLLLVGVPAVGCEKENITARRNKALSNPSERRPVRLRWTKLASGGIVDSAEQWSTETETTADIRAAADLTDWRSKQDEHLENLSKAPLKPQQRLWILR